VPGQIPRPPYRRQLRHWGCRARKAHPEPLSRVPRIPGQARVRRPGQHGRLYLPHRLERPGSKVRRGGDRTPPRWCLRAALEAPRHQAGRVNMAKFPMLPLYTDAFIADTLHLDPAEVGAYMLMLMAAWRTPDCSLPNDDAILRKITRMDARVWNKSKHTLLAF